MMVTEKLTDEALQAMNEEELGDALAGAYRVLKELMRRGYTVNLEITTPKEKADDANSGSGD